MRLLVTGASGFLGRAVVRAAVDAGHHVVALVRPTADVARMQWPPSVTVLRGDLRERGTWRDGIQYIDVVVHLAATATGELAQQFAGTVVATENLLANIDWTSIHRFVHVSSLSVYDYAAVSTGAMLDESARLETSPARRDHYTTTKLIQERLVQAACEARGVPAVVLRPGAIYGPGKDWNHGAALKLSGVSVVFSPRAAFRLTYVDNCAAAVVRAVDAPHAANRSLNIVDNDLPSHAQFLRLCRRAGASAGLCLPVPWILVASVGRLVSAINNRLLGGRARLPEFLTYRRVQARWKPLSYSNAQARAALGWEPAVSLRTGVSVTVGAGRT